MKDAQVVDVKHPVVSVSELGHKGTGSWFPSDLDADSECWLWRSAGPTWTYLPGPCLVGRSGTMPMEQDKGVFWLDLEHHPGDQEDYEKYK